MTFYGQNMFFSIMQAKATGLLLDQWQRRADVLVFVICLYSLRASSSPRS
jgi:hypothetical protein